LNKASIGEFATAIDDARGVGIRFTPLQCVLVKQIESFMYENNVAYDVLAEVDDKPRR